MGSILSENKGVLLFNASQSFFLLTVVVLMTVELNGKMKVINNDFNLCASLPEDRLQHRRRAVRIRASGECGFQFAADRRHASARTSVGGRS